MCCRYEGTKNSTKREEEGTQSRVIKKRGGWGVVAMMLAIEEDKERVEGS